MFNRRHFKAFKYTSDNIQMIDLRSKVIVTVLAVTNVYGAVIAAVNCHRESSLGAFGQSTTSARQMPTFKLDQST